MASRLKRAKDGGELLRRGDYRPPDWWVPEAALDIEILGERYRVRATLDVERAAGSSAPLRLDGEDLRLVELSDDGKSAAHKGNHRHGGAV